MIHICVVRFSQKKKTVKVRYTNRIAAAKIGKPVRIYLLLSYDIYIKYITIVNCYIYK